jgi:hypothetical protein
MRMKRKSLNDFRNRIHSYGCAKALALLSGVFSKDCYSVCEKIAA